MMEEREILDSRRRRRQQSELQFDEICLQMQRAFANSAGSSIARAHAQFQACIAPQALSTRVVGKSEPIYRKEDFIKFESNN